MADFSAYYAEADQQHWDVASCQEGAEERQGRVVVVVAVARTVDVGDIGKMRAWKSMR